jgi:hypothetical protein
MVVNRRHYFGYGNNGFSISYLAAKETSRFEYACD